MTAQLIPFITVTKVGVLDPASLDSDGSVIGHHIVHPHNRLVTQYRILKRVTRRRSRTGDPLVQSLAVDGFVSAPVVGCFIRRLNDIRV